MVATTLVSMMVVDLMEGNKGKISNRACDEAVICASKRWEKVEVLETSDGGRRRLLARLLVVVVQGEENGEEVEEYELSISDMEEMDEDD